MKDYDGIYAVCWKSDDGRHDIWSLHRNFDTALAEEEKCNNFFLIVHPGMKVKTFISNEYLED